MKNKFLILLVFALVIRIIFAFATYHPDVRNHVDWGIRFFEYGANGFYSPDANVWNYTWPNQPPGSIIMFAGIYQIYIFVFSILTWINQNISIFPSTIMYFLEQALYPALLQFPAIAADFGIAYLIYRILNKSKVANVGAILFLLNPAIWYNSSVWGQYDSVINFFALLSFYWLFRNKITASFLAIALSIYIKFSLAIFLPIYLLLILKQKIKFNKILVAIAVTLIVFSIVTYFFSRPDDPITWLYELYTKRILGQQLHVITANGFNIWALLTGIHEQPDTKMWGPMSYQFWSYILYIPFYLFTIWKIWKVKGETNVYAWIAVAALASFILLTNMHERYIYPLFPYLTIVVALNKSLMPIYWLVSGVSLINLYNFWYMPRIEPVVKFLEFGDRLMPRILGGLNTLLFFFFSQKVVRIIPNKQIK